VLISIDKTVIPAQQPLKSSPDGLYTRRRGHQPGAEN
jgi:hypothetical protein